MGCKCAGKTEEDEEILKHALEDGNIENAENEYNNNFNKNDYLLGLNNQQNENENENNNENKNDNENERENENENNILDNNEENNIDPNQKYADYPEKIVELINLIRADPVKYADTIENSIKNITEEPDKDDPSIQRLIYKKKVKVALIKGEPIFHEAIEYLRRQSPLPPLEVAPEKSIPLPNTEEELNDPTFLKGQVNIIRQNTKIDVFFKDLIKIPEVSGLLMIVDDVNKNAGKKRRALLSKDLKYICVNSKFVGKTFVAYFSFSKEK